MWDEAEARDVEPRVLFSGKHIYDLVEERRGLLKVAYEALPDDEALDEAATQALKKKFMLDVPTLRMNDWTSERREISPYSTEIITYIPFDGDPAVFDVQPVRLQRNARLWRACQSRDTSPHSSEQRGSRHPCVRPEPELKEIEWRLKSVPGCAFGLGTSGKLARCRLSRTDPFDECIGDYALSERTVELVRIARRKEKVCLFIKRR